MADSKNPNLLQAVLRDVDKQFIALVEKGADLSKLPITDWQAFAKGFASRNAIQVHTKRMRWMVAEKILCSCYYMGWDLPWLMERGYLIFPYEQVQKNLSLLSLLARLEADGVIYLAAQQASQVQANKSVSATPATASKYYDAWGDWYTDGVRKPSEWDIEQVNCINQNLTDLITYLTLFAEETETGNDPHNYAAVVAEALPVVQEFKDYFPTFCALLNEANVLDLTEKVVIEEPVELAITLPETTSTAQAEKSAKSQQWKPLVRVQKNNSVSDFQGFFVGIVLEPRAEDDRDLDGCYMSREEVEKAANYWSVNHQRVRVNHEDGTEANAFEHPDFRLVYNWVEQGEPVIGGYKIRPGTWMQAYQAVSEKGKSMIQNYEINGLSPGGPTNIWRDPKPSEEAQ